MCCNYYKNNVIRFQICNSLFSSCCLTVKNEEWETEMQDLKKIITCVCVCMCVYIFLHLVFSVRIPTQYLISNWYKLSV